ncbi:hypothetical protein CCYA_CCYA01G0358 [Cyanidiococcus yangmingshanensis]|nr:hypothetical protein CCYA_CCYA01G0358 [Cyanidiococcus yangmingshanensis]
MLFRPLSDGTDSSRARTGLLVRSDPGIADAVLPSLEGAIQTPTWIIPTVRGTVPGIANTLLGRYCLSGDTDALQSSPQATLEASEISKASPLETAGLAYSSFCIGMAVLDFWNYKGTREPDGAAFFEQSPGWNARHYCNWEAFPGPLVLSIRSALSLFDFLEHHGHPVVVRDGDVVPAMQSSARKENKAPSGLVGDTRGSRMPVTVDRILNLQQVMQCEFYETLYEANSNLVAQSPMIPSDGRHARFVDAISTTADAEDSQDSVGNYRYDAESRTRQWAERMLDAARSRSLPGRVLLSMLAHGSETQLARSVAWALEQTSCYGSLIGGFNIVGLGVDGASSTDVYRLCSTLGEKLRANAPHLPVFCTGGSARVVDGSPPLVLRLIASGVDVVESRYPFIMAECGYALDLFNESCSPEEEVSAPTLYVSVRNGSWVKDARPFLLRCRSPASERRCRIGRKYARAYWYHLFQVHEMLGPILLILHNVQQYLAFFDEIQEAIREGSFHALCTRFQAIP